MLESNSIEKFTKTSNLEKNDDSPSGIPLKPFYTPEDILDLKFI